MIDYGLFILGELPDFLSSEPISSLWGLILTAYIIKLLKDVFF